MKITNFYSNLGLAYCSQVQYLYLFQKQLTTITIIISDRSDAQSYKNKTQVVINHKYPLSLYQGEQWDTLQLLDQQRMVTNDQKGKNQSRSHSGMTTTLPTVITEERNARDK